MLQSPVNKIPYNEDRITEFQGWNRRVAKEAGEMCDMKNLCSDQYPSLYQRKGMTMKSNDSLWKTIDVISRQDYSDDRKQKLFEVVGNGPNTHHLTIDGNVASDFGIFSDDTRMVAINSKICFFPEKTYYDTRSGEYGSLEARATCEYGSDAAGFALLFLPRYSSIARKYGGVKLEIDSEQEFKIGDVIEIKGSFRNGLTGDDEISVYYGDESDEEYIRVKDEFPEYKWVVKPTVSTMVLYSEVSPSSTRRLTLIVQAGSFPEFENEVSQSPAASTTRSFSAVRATPDMDHVIEWNNRLWGCSNDDNRIYACKLGDPTNWQYYQQTNMDSYYAEQGSDGDFTGVGKYSNHLLFFKEDCIHKVYGTAPSSYQIVTTNCYGVEKGSERSVCVVNDMVFYKSRLGFMAYQGELPDCISRKLGDFKFDNVVAGTDGFKYYATVHDIKEDKYIMLVCDTENALWHKYDEIGAAWFVWHKGEVLMGTNPELGPSGIVYAIEDDDSAEEIEWFAEFGPFDEYIENKKITNRIDMRFHPEEESTLRVYIMMDESGEWELVDTIVDQNELVAHSVYLPRRCNRFSIKLEGEGRCRIDSIRRQFREGTGGGL